MVDAFPLYILPFINSMFLKKHDQWKTSFFFISFSNEAIFVTIHFGLIQPKMQPLVLTIAINVCIVVPNLHINKERKDELAQMLFFFRSKQSFVNNEFYRQLQEFCIWLTGVRSSPHMRKKNMLRKLQLKQCCNLNKREKIQTNSLQ